MGGPRDTVSSRRSPGRCSPTRDGGDKPRGPLGVVSGTRVTVCVFESGPLSSPGMDFFRVFQFGV